MKRSLDHFTHGFFFGNYFYGICAVMLSIEANIQLGLPLNHPLFYISLGLATILFYTHAYRLEHRLPTLHPRINWYKRNFRRITMQQFVGVGLLCLTAGYYLYQLSPASWQSASLGLWGIMAIFPLGALLYDIRYLPGRHPGIRWNGWIKPFVIGFIWAGAVTLYPPILQGFEQGKPFSPSLLNLLLFVKNGMYIGMLCILFDIKDYATDYNQQLKTFVVRWGLRKTLFRIIIPLTCLGLGIFLLYGIGNHFPLTRLLMNSIPFILLIFVTHRMHQRKSILYYLAVIDGLMLVKACCGIAGSLLWR